MEFYHLSMWRVTAVMGGGGGARQPCIFKLFYIKNAIIPKVPPTPSSLILDRYMKVNKLIYT